MTQPITEISRVSRVRMWFLVALMIVPLFALIHPAGADHGQNDAGSGGDAGDSISAAIPVTPFGLYSGLLSAESSDPNDYYSFPAELGKQINIEIRNALFGGSLVAGDNDDRFSFRLLGPEGVPLDTPNTNQGDTRVAIAAAPVTGTYYFQVTKAIGARYNYQFCFIVISGNDHSCPDIGMRPIDVIFGGSLRQATTRVLLVPPAHGDLGNPQGPGLNEYLTTTYNAIHEWESAIGMFIAEHPEYGYLNQINIDVQIFDGVMSTTDYDVAIVYVETAATAFRGVASSCFDTPRCIALSLFSSSPRGGQLVPDYPELNDLDAVVKHEFGHTFGVGHTLSWTAAQGPDLMNSPAPFMYGDGNPAGDGGERTGRKCLSNLNLYALAKIYEWLPSGHWSEPDASRYNLPAGWAYTWYCP